MTMARAMTEAEFRPPTLPATPEITSATNAWLGAYEAAERCLDAYYGDEEAGPSKADVERACARRDAAWRALEKAVPVRLGYWEVGTHRVGWSKRSKHGLGLVYEPVGGGTRKGRRS
jgi:hypothetical protein